jgi:TolB protein
VTDFRGPDVSPTWNPKTGAQIAWISGRTGLPQLYIMDSDGSGVYRLTDGGYATSPSWSPNGQFIAFAWDRKYGPGAPGGQDIYVMEIATKRWIQLTHDSGRCDFPSWSPDGRHLVYASSPDGRADHTRIMTMLADGTQKRALTGPGADMPNWSWR